MKLKNDKSLFCNACFEAWEKNKTVEALALNIFIYDDDFYGFCEICYPPQFFINANRNENSSYHPRPSAAVLEMEKISHSNSISINLSFYSFLSLPPEHQQHYVVFQL